MKRVVLSTATRPRGNESFRDTISPPNLIRNWYIEKIASYQLRAAVLQYLIINKNHRSNISKDTVKTKRGLRKIAIFTRTMNATAR